MFLQLLLLLFLLVVLSSEKVRISARFLKVVVMVVVGAYLRVGTCSWGRLLEDLCYLDNGSLEIIYSATEFGCSALHISGRY